MKSEAHKKRKRSVKQVDSSTVLVTVEHLQGLQTFVLNELKRYKGTAVLSKTKDSVSVVSKSPFEFLELRSIIAAYWTLSFEIPRPKALLGDEHFGRLLKVIREITTKGSFSSFRLSAAGKDSGIFVRLSERIEKESGLAFGEEGDLLLRIRPSRTGWDVLVRLSPRPQSARAYRRCNMAGGLNATLAFAMNELAGSHKDDVYLNAMCGSGTLLIERALAAPCKRLMGVDLNEEALECSRQNIRGARIKAIDLINRDATKLPFEDGYFNVITSDLPWGDAVGSHEGNKELYPAFLEEMGRVSSKDARFVLLTHEIKLFERVMKSQSTWQIVKEHKVYHGGHYPRMYLLRK